MTRNKIWPFLTSAVSIVGSLIIIARHSRKVLSLVIECSVVYRSVTLSTFAPSLSEFIISWSPLINSKVKALVRMSCWLVKLHWAMHNLPHRMYVWCMWYFYLFFIYTFKYNHIPCGLISATSWLPKANGNVRSCRIVAAGEWLTGLDEAAETHPK